MSAGIIAQTFLQDGMEAEAVDARQLIVTDDRFGSARWIESETQRHVEAFFADFHSVAVITGFIGSTLDGTTTTLGRGGSDFTAGILGACLKAEEIQIWTDVDGIMTADSKAVPDAFVIPEISYVEAMEMSHFGAKILLPSTILPAMSENIPVRILNIFNPQSSGTRIVKEAAPSTWPVRGIAAIPSISLLLLQGPGLPGVTGIAGRMFAALAAAQVNVILITQGSSELSICCAVLPQDAIKGAQALKKEFHYEIDAGSIQTSIESGLSVIAVVGEMMRHRVGISGRVFKALGRNGINVIAIAQGSSELNISIVVSETERNKAMGAIHDAFFLAGVRTVNVFLVGTGLIGGTLLSQVAEQHNRLFKDRSIRVSVAGIINTHNMLIAPQGIDIGRWREILSTGGEKANLDRFVKSLLRLNLPNACFCDCTASEIPVKYYEPILSASVSVVTPNKRANSGALAQYRRLMDTAREMDVPYRYETTVGAGLPVIGTIQDLVASGDEIVKIEAVLSGTISYIFNNLGSELSFSELVKKAKQLGYTEPDPRDDLSAKDIARKTTILAREVGYGFEESDVKIEPLISERVSHASSIEDCLALLPEMDGDMEKRRQDAMRKDAVLRYVSVITKEGCQLSLCEYGPESPFYSLTGTDNMVVITSKRYSKNPLVIRGPGAGADVTAGGVFADILKTAESYL